MLNQQSCITMSQACQIKSCYLLKDCKNSYHNVVLPFLLSVSFIRVHTISIYSFKLTVFAAEWDYVYINMWQTYRKFVFYLMYSWESIITFSGSFKVIVLPKMIYQPWNIFVQILIQQKYISIESKILYIPSRPACILSTRNCTHKLFNVFLPVCMRVDFDLNLTFSADPRKGSWPEGHCAVQREAQQEVPQCLRGDTPTHLTVCSLLKWSTQPIT